MKRNKFCKLDIVKELELCGLYNLGFSTWMLSKIFNTAQWTPQNTVHRYYRLGILGKIRNNEESTRARYLLENKATLIPTFPSSEFVRNLIKRNLSKYLDRLICVMLLTDGFVSKNSIIFVNNSETMHNVFFDLMYYVFHITPTSFRKTKKKNQTTYVRKEILDIVSQLNMYIPSFKKSPSKNQEIEKYLSEQQPSLDFLLDSPREIQIEVFRLGMCAEGSVTPTTYDKKYIRGHLNLACAHPRIVKQWIEIARNIGFLKFRVIKNKENWSGIQGISSSSIKDLEHFYKIGGFLNGVKIGRGSPYYFGIDKQRVLTSLLEFIETKRPVNSLNDLHSQIIYLSKNQV